MKKAGLITLHESSNFGALLQAYALSRTIENFNIECEIINHNRFGDNNKEGKSNFYKVRSYLNRIKRFINKSNFYKVRSFSNRTRNIKLLLNNPSIINISTKRNKLSRLDKIDREKCRKFMDEYLNISNRKYTEIEEIKNEPPLYDYYICGSDQIWNPNRSYYFEPFFLTFAPEKMKKIAYAPSIALNTIPEHLIDTYKEYLKSLNHISVREEQGAHLISNIIGRKVPALIDPTLLLDYNDWDKIAICPEIKVPYVLCYFICHRALSSFRKVINQLANTLNTKIVVVPSKLGVLDNNWLTLNGTGPREFLGLIREAECVVTNSFHGVVLSINYNKDFYVCEYKTGESRFSRIANILDKLNLENRIISDKQKIIHSSIDYCKVNKLLSIERAKSYDFLEKALDITSKDEKDIGDFNSHSSKKNNNK